VLLAASAAPTRAAGPGPTDPPRQCDFDPADSRFVVRDGGVDGLGNTVAWCAGYRGWGGRPALGLPISRPFRVGDVWYQAFEYGLLQWNQDQADTTLVDVLDVLHAAGRDPTLQRLGVPPRQEPNPAWLDGEVDDLYGLPTSPQVSDGSYLIQRFQRALSRQWLESVPDGGDAGHVERVMVGDLLRSTGLIPPAALVAGPADDPQQYNWSGVPTVPASFWAGPDRAVGGWDALFHRAGAFDIGTADPDESAMKAEIDQAADLGLTLAVDGYVGRDSAVFQRAADRNVGLIDTYLWGRIDAACGPALEQQTCRLSPGQLDGIEQAVRHHLQITRQDDGVVGYWILDDYPGDVRPALELLHRLVMDENLLDREPRPTICGFGGRLDPDARQPLAASRAAFDTAIGNFSPTACDAVALYPYAGPRDPSGTDWSMARLLPYMQARLREKGWDPARQPLVGIPEAFRAGASAAPTATDLAVQTAAYCAAGASSIIFFAWDDSSPSAKWELVDTPDLRRGVADGLGRCRAVWDRA
jgi:hypothetical protein